MAMAMQIGVGPQESVQLGIAQRGLLQNPGGATGNLSPSKRQTDPTTDPNNPSNTQGNNPVATQLLLAPTFTPINARTVLDMNSGRVAVPVTDINGEFIITMTKGNAAQQAGEQPGQGAAGINSTSNANEGLSPNGAAGVTVSMVELEGLIQRQKNGGVFLAEQMMADFMKQQGQQGPAISVKNRGVKGPRKPQPFFG